MRLRLDDLGTTLQPAAETQQPDGSLVSTAPPLTLVLSPLTLLAATDPGADATAELPAWVGRDCPPGCSVQVVSEQPGETALGWPLRLVHAQIVGPDGSTVVEERLGASYQFLRYTATALVRVGNAPETPLATQRPQLLQLLRSGRPDWRDPEAGVVTALWDIWQ